MEASVVRGGIKMRKDSLYDIIFGQCVEALLFINNPRGFTALARSNPSIYLGVSMAEKVAEVDLEAALVESSREVDQRFEIYKAMGLDRWARLMAMDDMMASLARMYALGLRRPGYYREEIEQKGEIPELFKRLRRIGQQRQDREQGKDRGGKGE
jgi:hypothetical protein